MNQIEELHIGENKLVEIALKDKNGDDFVIASLSFLEAALYQFEEEIESYNLFPVGDPEVTYSGSILTVEITKTLSEVLRPGFLLLRIKCNNPNALFTDGGQHISIDPLTIFKVVV